jgi:cofilin
MKSASRYVIYHIKDDKVQVEKIAARDASYDDFLGDLPADDCRYASYDFEFETDDGRPQKKLLFIIWCVGRAGAQGCRCV